MPNRQYAPRRARVGPFGVDSTMHPILGQPPPATRRMVPVLVFNNTGSTTDATVTIWFGNTTPANNYGGLKLTVPHRASYSFLSHAELVGLHMEPGWGVWFRVDSGGACTAEAHYLEEIVGAPVNYDPMSAIPGISTGYSAVIPVSAKRRIVMSVNGFLTGGGDSSFYLWCGPTAPGVDAYSLRWAALALTNPTNFMSTAGVPLHLEAGDGLWARGDTAGNNYLQINYMEEQ
jgi:hypothetical protein